MDLDHDVLDRQHEQWTRTFTTREAFMGAESSRPAQAALGMYRTVGVRDLLELGPGQGRDTLLFAEAGLRVTALDYAEEALAEVARKAAALQPAGTVTAVQGDVRAPLPFAESSFDAAYAHLLFCMALTTLEIERLAAEVRRVLRPAGLLVYTARDTTDPHYGTGIDRGDGMFETNGFIVHFFDRALIDRLAEGFQILDVRQYEEGRIPLRLSAVTMRKT